MKSLVIAAATGLMLCGTAACSSSTSGSGDFNAHSPNTGPAAGHSTGTSSAPALGGGGKDASAWCAELDQAGPAIIGAGNPGALPDDWQTKAEALAADAPDDIRADVETLVKGDEKIINGDATGDETPEFLKAGQHVVQWLSANCPSLLQKYNPGFPAGSPTG